MLVPPDQDLGAVTLADGRRVALRFGRPGDRGAIVRGFERLSPRSRYLRFFSPMRQIPPGLLDRLADVDRTDRVAVIAYLVDEPDELVGVVRYFRDPASPTEADVALTVLDDYQGQGLAGAMYDACVDVARSRGIECFTASVLAENGPMIGFFRNRGAEIRRDPRDPCELAVRLPL